MLRPASVNLLLQQLISDDGKVTKPHTALLSLLKSSQLYAYATRLSKPSKQQTKRGLTSGSASSSIKKQHVVARSIPFSLDERATCLSAIAVTAWRNAAAQPSISESAPGGSFIAGPGMPITVSKHNVFILPGANVARKVQSKDIVPLLLECELGRILIMPIVLSQPQTTPSRDEFVNHDNHDEGSPHPTLLQEVQQPFMLLALNAPLPSSDPYAQSSLASSFCPRFLSRGTTPATSYGSSGNPIATATPTRSPTRDHFPCGNKGDDAEQAEGEYKCDKEEEMVWRTLYAQAKAFARLLTPSLSKCGVGHGLNDEENGDGWRSANVISEDENDD